MTIFQFIIRIGSVDVEGGEVMLEGGRVKVWVLPPDVNVVVTLGPVALEDEFEKNEDGPDDDEDSFLELDSEILLDEP